MTTGIDARLERIGTDGSYVIVPMDHGITMGAVQGLKDIEATIDGVTSGGADAVLTQKGVAPRVHENKNGKGYIVHLNGSTTIGPDEQDKRMTGSVEEAIRVGADAVSFHINVGSDHEPGQISQLSEVTERAKRFGIPVLAMAYARGPGVDSEDAESLGHAVRLAEELGADIVKTGYSGDAESFQHVVESTRLPVVIAGGSKGSDRETIEMVRGVMDAGGAGVSMGRSIFQHENPEAIARAVAGVVHEDLSTDEALAEAGLALEA
ncbi:2-amino-3,7-dideoxy-D-threo-hept-6-ulosonate synthase [Natrinema salaciae]|uniref:2-amino-3,7-dideoxy-D-threo-hept-6-ulosonate synthase n=1 Tax=Natrinema salaciae TaxID=1186196 RepID=A0A1H9QAI1_9EURY|nr:2-amino-3,7-dideoxy-D-threo-hept-6-ulosonate synthase [Natrinema salaciae]SER56833.1 2-amino-3,7-dideoxy-D-threo-hept-6-ulosonate synthase [Natrinema salaciae]